MEQYYDHDVSVQFTVIQSSIHYDAVAVVQFSGQQVHDLIHHDAVITVVQ